MIEIRIDVDEAKLKEASQQERMDFMTARFEAGSVATSRYGAIIDWSDSLHWIIKVPKQHERVVRKLLEG